MYYLDVSNTKYFSFVLSYPTFLSVQEKRIFSTCSLLFFNHSVSLVEYPMIRVYQTPDKNGQSEAGNYGSEKMLCPIPDRHYGYGIVNTDHRT